MCINKAGPCYYQLCYPNGQSSTSKVFKCARGLIFDEKFQKCVWSLPWHACQSDIETTTSSFSTVSIKQEIINELKFRPGEKQLVTLFAKDLPEKIREFRSSNDSFDLTNSDQSEYAYIVVPIKLNRNQKMSVPKIKLKKKNRKNKNKRPMVNLDQLYKYKKICYVTNWSQYRPGAARFLPENVDPFLCTHIIFAFAYIDKNTLTIRTIEENDEEMYKRINDLKFKNPKLKTMLAIGGWNMASEEFSAMVKKKQTRKNFIIHAIRFLRFYNFDGIDLDWEFPGDRGGDASDKPNFTKLIKEFRQSIIDESLDQDQDQLILSIAVAAGKKRIDQGYEVKKIAGELDFVNLMAFDFHGNWDDKTGLNAPLYNHENATGSETQFTQDWAVTYWIKNGCPPHKLVLGLPAYGRSFHLRDQKKSGLLSETIQNDVLSGSYTQTAGFLSFYEICDLKKNKNWTQVWQSQSKSHYLHQDFDWISYDDIKSFQLRTAYVVAKKLGGIFIWSIDMDDFSGKFCNQGSYPLIKNSMSLLMDYLPEWYSSNVNKKEKIMLKNSRIQTSVNANVFYVLKEEVNLLDESDADFELVKQNRIRNDLLLLLSHQPEKFFSLSLSESFNCGNKKKGLYRDPLDCSKYYFCDEENIGGKRMTKALKCQLNSFFDLKSCSCLKRSASTKCEHLIETYCDLKKFKKL
ncbi:chitotriosidase-1 [Brachionus plicatilis]|uniref:Chitotriosidase-1 n=1 Tax=Brachionus plicatilis TaxID=10195 RepID=A0A3M7RQ10_BRAPC|nr:chitotriosidase-1 [Brachionus plicatilis]